jgi:hypothetical protein
MVEIISLEGTEDTPKIVLDPKTGVFEFIGRSLPEDAMDFYEPIVEWFGRYKNSPNAQTKVIFKLEYINSASTKACVDVLKALEPIPHTQVVWVYDDEDIEDLGKQFARLVKVPFQITREDM